MANVSAIKELQRVDISITFIPQGQRVPSKEPGIIQLADSDMIIAFKTEHFRLVVDGAEVSTNPVSSSVVVSPELLAELLKEGAKGKASEKK